MGILHGGKCAAIFAAFACALGMGGQVLAQKKGAEAPGAKRVVVYARNDSGNAKLDGSVRFLERAVESRLNAAGFAVVDRELAVKSLQEYLDRPQAADKAAVEKAKEIFEKSGFGANLFADASGLRVAEIIGADYVLTLGLGSFAVDKRLYSGYGISTDNENHVLRSNYSFGKIAGGGAGITGGAVKSSAVLRRTDGSLPDGGDILNSLVEDTARQVAMEVSKSLIVKNDTPDAPQMSDVSIVFALEELYLPEFVKKDGEFVLTGRNVPFHIPYVTALVDGVARTVGGSISLSKGLHTLKISQADIAPVEMHINVTGELGQRLALSLKISEDARRRWKDDLEFVEKIKARAARSDDLRKLTDAEAERLRGVGKSFENSGFKVNIDADNLPEVHRTQSIFGQ